jgi:hypothetical protein
MDPITLKVVLIAWMLDAPAARVLYFMPITVLPDEATCQKTLEELKETHKRGYAYNLVVRGACLPANIGG